MTERRFPRLAKLVAVGVVLVTQVTCADDPTSPQVMVGRAAWMRPASATVPLSSGTLKSTLTNARWPSSG